MVKKVVLRVGGTLRGRRGWLPCRIVPFDGSSPGFEREFLARQVGLEPTSLVNRVRALLLKMQDLRLVSGEKTQSPAARIWWDRAYPHPLLILEPECKRIPCGNPSRRRKAMGSDRLQLFLETKRYSYLA